MPSPPKLQPVRGMADVLSTEYEAADRVQQQLEQLFRQYGYRPIGLPVVEYTDLHLRKSGADIVGRLYDFTHQDRHLCLRPEMTASVMRAYVNNLQERPLPIRLHYAGPVFRYEKPQRGRYRQFTTVGLELIGAAHNSADAETIHIACAGLDALGLQNYRVLIGNVGLLTTFLAQLGLDDRLQNFLIANMERLRSEGKAALCGRVHDIYPSLAKPITDEADEPLAGLLVGLSVAESRTAVSHFLANMNVDITGSRSADQIVDRLLAKMQSADQSARLEQALSFMEALGGLVGEQTAVLTAARELMAEYGMEETAVVDELRQLLDMLTMYGLDSSRIQLDLGLTRGMQYYTGTLFEIYHDDGRGAEQNNGAMQLCGGGRYDDLATVLGGAKNVPAVGFAYGLERLCLALQDEQGVEEDQSLSDALIIPVTFDDYAYAVQVATQLRANGATIELDVRDRSLKGNLQYADKQNIAYAIIVGANERKRDTVLLRNMHSRDEQQVTIANAALAINGNV